MKILIPLLFASTTLFAQQTEAKKGEAQTSHSPEAPSFQSVMNIDPKKRAEDFSRALDVLRKEKPSMKVYLQTTHMNFTNLVDITPLPNGTLVAVKYTANHGTALQIVPVEDLLEVNYSP